MVVKKACFLHGRYSIYLRSPVHPQIRQAEVCYQYHQPEPPLWLIALFSDSFTIVHFHISKDAHAKAIKNNASTSAKSKYWDCG